MKILAGVNFNIEKNLRGRVHATSPRGKTGRPWATFDFDAAAGFRRIVLPGNISFSSRRIIMIFLCLVKSYLVEIS